MREILFRGKRIDNGEWVYGYLFRCFDGDMFMYATSGEVVHVDSETVGQFTGLVDSNGTKIFEGDIIEMTGHIWGFTSGAQRGTVRWEDSSCGFEPFSDSIHNCGHCGGGEDPNYVEVIGNIHDNPELLEEKK